MKKLIISVVFALAEMFAVAQTVQRGIVQEYNEAAPKTALPGVEVRVYPAQSTVSDAQGKFELEFLTLNPGERINVRRIEKEGYEIFNKDALEQWNLSPDNTFSIVMCRSDRFKQLKDTYYANSSERYSRQYRNATAELRRLRDANRLQQQEFADSLRVIEDLYARQLENLDNYVDRFARIDLSEISAAEQEIIALVREGNIDEAIASYDELDIEIRLLSAIRQRKEIDAAMKRMSEIRMDNIASQDSLYDMAERQIQTLQLAGDSRNNAKILNLYRSIADADTTNVNWLINTANYIDESIGDYDLALKYAQTAVNSLLNQERPDEILLATAYNNLGLVCLSQSNNDKAIEYLNKALDIRLRILNREHHPLVATTYNNLGVAYSQQGNYAKAIDFYNKALEIQLRVMSPENSDVAITYNNFGSVYRSQGSYAKAIYYFNKALFIQLRVLGPEHPDVAVTYGNLGFNSTLYRDYAKAIYYFNKALDIDLRVLGPEHPKVAATYYGLGVCYNFINFIGDNAKAIDYYNKALDIKNNIFGPEHPDLVIIYNSLGRVYEFIGDYAKALDYYNKELDIQLRVLGSDNPEVTACYRNIAFLLVYTSDDFADSKENFRKAISALERDPNLDKEYISCLYNLYLNSLIRCADANPEILPELSDYMADKLWIGIVEDDDMPAAEKGLSGEYYILEFGDWDFTRDHDVSRMNEALQGQPKSLVLMQDDSIGRYDFENQVGMELQIRKVTPEEKTRVTESYRQWKNNNE